VRRALVRKLHAAVVGEWKMRIVGDFPQMPVEIGEIAGIATPEDVLRRLANDGTGISSAFDDRIDVVLRTAVLSTLAALSSTAGPAREAERGARVSRLNKRMRLTRNSRPDKH
jgi:hypothetical protein